MKRGAATDRKQSIAPPTEPPADAPMPPILPEKKQWRDAVLQAAGLSAAPLPDGARRQSPKHYRASPAEASRLVVPPYPRIYAGSTADLSQQERQGKAQMRASRRLFA